MKKLIYSLYLVAKNIKYSFSRSIMLVFAITFSIFCIYLSLGFYDIIYSYFAQKSDLEHASADIVIDTGLLNEENFFSIRGIDKLSEENSFTYYDFIYEVAVFEGKENGYATLYLCDLAKTRELFDIFPTRMGNEDIIISKKMAKSENLKMGDKLKLIRGGSEIEYNVFYIADSIFSEDGNYNILMNNTRNTWFRNMVLINTEGDIDVLIETLKESPSFEFCNIYQGFNERNIKISVNSVYSPLIFGLIIVIIFGIYFVVSATAWILRHKKSVLKAYEMSGASNKTLFGMLSIESFFLITLAAPIAYFFIKLFINSMFVFMPEFSVKLSWLYFVIASLVLYIFVFLLSIYWCFFEGVSKHKLSIPTKKQIVASCIVLLAILILFILQSIFVRLPIFMAIMLFCILGYGIIVKSLKQGLLAANMQIVAKKAPKLYVPVRQMQSSALVNKLIIITSLCVISMSALEMVVSNLESCLKRNAGVNNYEVSIVGNSNIPLSEIVTVLDENDIAYNDLNELLYLQATLKEIDTWVQLLAINPETVKNEYIVSFDITKLKDNEIVLPMKLKYQQNLKENDTISIEYNGMLKPYTIAGFIEKDEFLIDVVIVTLDRFKTDFEITKDYNIILVDIPITEIPRLQHAFSGYSYITAIKTRDIYQDKFNEAVEFLGIMNYCIISLKIIFLVLLVISMTSHFKDLKKNAVLNAMFGYDKLSRLLYQVYEYIFVVIIVTIISFFFSYILNEQIFYEVLFFNGYYRSVFNIEILLQNILLVGLFLLMPIGLALMPQKVQNKKPAD